MQPTVPAVRSSLDVAFWLLETAAREHVPLNLLKLRQLLYLAQAHFAVEQGGGKLMPATFVAASDGPTEPNVQLVLESGLQNPWAPETDAAAGAFLGGFWQRFGALPSAALERLIFNDGVWRAASTGAELSLEAMRKAYANPDARIRSRKTAKPAADDPPLQPLPPDAGELRFTADGRAVTRWKPKRRVDPPRR